MKLQQVLTATEQESKKDQKVKVGRFVQVFIVGCKQVPAKIVVAHGKELYSRGIEVRVQYCKQFVFG